MKPLQRLIIVFSILIVLFGFSQLNNEKDIFEQSKAYCCNEGKCTYPNALCTGSSSMNLKPDCIEYGVTCRECVDYNASGQVCDDPKNSCKDQNNNCYGWCYFNGTWQWVLSK
ncbi:MAG: hypothetical protein WAU11_03920 [Ignavibacteriaceae bacterium]